MTSPESKAGATARAPGMDLGVRAAMQLWDNADCAVWDATLDRYPAVVRAQEVTGLVDLDRWYHDDLPGLIAGRTPPYITRDELARVTSWKMKRGVWRERN